MKVVILAGGLGTRLSEETDIKPKPMIEIGGRPILWHIMKIYSHFGFNEFVICLGYKGYVIKEYFANYFLHESDVTFDIKNNNFEVHTSEIEPWKITLVDTGAETMTGGRLKRVQKYVGNEPFMLTYGDGLGDVNIKELVDYHQKTQKLATVTAIQTHGRFGSLNFDSNGFVQAFQEKPKNLNWVNGGFFVLEPQVFDYIESETDSIWEKKPLENLVMDGQLTAYQHNGFWHPMDTLRDKLELEDLWKSPNCAWKVWA